MITHMRVHVKQFFGSEEVPTRKLSATIHKTPQILVRGKTGPAQHSLLQTKSVCLKPKNRKLNTQTFIQRHLKQQPPALNPKTLHPQPGSNPIRNTSIAYEPETPYDLPKTRTVPLLPRLQLLLALGRHPPAGQGLGALEAFHLRLYDCGLSRFSGSQGLGPCNSVVGSV